MICTTVSWLPPRVTSIARGSASDALQRLLVVFVGIVTLGGYALAPQALNAAEPTGLQAAIAIEQAMVAAIEAAEKSVVSIARVNRDEAPAKRNAGMLLPLQRGGVGQLPPSSDPRDSNFVPKEFATGVVIDAKGLILTNYHCVQKDDDHLITTVNRKVFRCTSIFAADPRSDLAILKVDDTPPVAAGDFVPLKFGDAKGLKKGQIVIALGNPYGIARDGQVSASWGIISNLSRKLGPQPVGEEPTLHQFGTLIQTDARLNWGTRGGALVNLQGEMVGLTTSLAATSGYEQAAGYAIPIDDTFRRVIEVLKQGRKVDYGFLGVSHASPDRLGMTPQMNFNANLHRGRPGLVVDGVTPGGPASRAGISPGEVITHIDGQPVNNFDDLRLLVGRFGAGDAARVIYERRHERGAEVLTTDVLLGKYHKQPLLKAREAVFTHSDAAWRGMQIDFSSVVDMRDSGFPTRIVTAEVEAETPAYRAGVRSGMFIASVGATPVDSPAEFRRAVAKLKGDVTIHFVEDSRFRGEYPRQQAIKIPDR